MTLSVLQKKHSSLDDVGELISKQIAILVVFVKKL
jgi:hypothetical protein